MKPKEVQEKPMYLSTGIAALDEILSMDVERRADQPEGGILIARSLAGRDYETPIILINGETGAGKTTLMLQIAYSAAAKDSHWLPCFCSLEQSVQSLEGVSKSFRNFQRIDTQPSRVKMYDLANVKNKTLPFNKKEPLIYMCHLAPRPISEGGNTNLFELRLDQLNHIIEEIKKNSDSSLLPVFFLDSINAFSIDLLERNELYRLYSLFRNNHVPAVLTMEHHTSQNSGPISDCVENAKFLSDIVISLTKDSSGNYLKYYLEIEKSRVSRQALGKHIYKIRTHAIAQKIQHDPRTGIVLYPSIHSVLSKAKQEVKESQDWYTIYKQDESLNNVIKDNKIKLGECFSIIGPPGTHKLALGMNLAMGYRNNRPPSLLIVNFGGSGDFKFDGVAWTQSRRNYQNLKKISKRESDVKFWNTQYSCGLDAGGGKKIDQAYVTIISFKLGQITPEECFYIIDKAICEAKTDHPYSSVLLSDTAELCNGFPLLASDPLFLPALIELFGTRELVTICIGVDEGHSAKNRDINFSLSSRADYRIVLSHYPDVAELSSQIVDYILFGGYDENSGTQPACLKEQLVSLVVDNVTGKHYSREPRWISVRQIDDKHKELLCTKVPDLSSSSEPFSQMDNLP